MPSWSESRRSADLRLALKPAYRRAEDDALQQLLIDRPLAGINLELAQGIAAGLIGHIRRAQSASRIEQLLSEFNLDSTEGKALMSLTEALLRVPDALTSRQLISDKLLAGKWGRHWGGDRPLFVNGAALGLLLASRLLRGGLSATLSTPLIAGAVRASIHLLGVEFVQGKAIAQALQRARKQLQRGYSFSFDMLGEGARTQAAADRYLQKYQQAIDAVGAAAGQVQAGLAGSQGLERLERRRLSVSVKLSALHPRYHYSQKQRVINELVPRLLALALRAKHWDIDLTVDAEEANRLELSLDIIAAVFRDRQLDAWQGFGFAVQAYQKRALGVVHWALQLARDCERRLNLRLVKGAYWDSEIKWSQLGGYTDYPLFTEKAATDLSYLTCAEFLLRHRRQLRPQFATHNACTVAAILALDEAVCKASAGALQAQSGYEFQRLHGMGAALYERLLADYSLPCRIYAPVGEHQDLLPYLVRRMLENGANSSFVRQVNPQRSPGADPVDQLRQLLQAGLKSGNLAPGSHTPLQRNPRIPRPVDLLRRANSGPGGEVVGRENSSGLDLLDDSARQRLDELLRQWQPVADSTAGAATAESAVAVRNPAANSQVVGFIKYDSSAQLQHKLQTAAAAQAEWSQIGAAARGQLLRTFASRLQQQREELIVLLVKEAGKTLADADAEVREAVDFCRYYADQAELIYTENTAATENAKNPQVDAPRPLGVVLSISPWNFPLAIFCGQLSAALAAGNTVIAKPAEQTSLIAIKTRQLMLEAGFPAAVIQLAIAPGKVVGDALVGQDAVRGVVFTGSIATARWLAQRLAARDSEVVLIAETGGQNTMLVDATALPEQVVDDVLESAFQSAGQRCSALRVLYIQAEVADDLISLLQQAMAELRIGDPAELATDVGPLIDSAAVTRLQQHQQYLQLLGPQVKLWQQQELPDHCGDGNFFAPCLYEIPSIKLLTSEVFGPLLHVIRYHAAQLPQVIDEINSSGFGLTQGIHSRIMGRAEEIAARISAGNVYINRNMIGAVVGVQPFGGRGLSGTGPKAGGPNYLQRLVTRRCAAAGDCGAALPGLTEAGLTEAGLTEAGLTEAELTAGLTEPGLAEPVAGSAAAESLPLAGGVLLQLDIKARYDLCLQACHKFAAGAALLQRLELVNSRYWPRINLPGPAGESNSLDYEARGLLALLLAPQAENTPGAGEELLALWSALLCGNTVVLLAPAARLAEAEGWLQKLASAGFPQGVANVLPIEASSTLFKSAALKGVVDCRNAYPRKAIQQTLLHCHSALLPLIYETHPEALLPRLMLEKTVTINTAASGGITELLA